LSGGEQQMLTLCRTLMGDPDLIIIDEPTEGLAPKIVALVGQYLRNFETKRYFCFIDRTKAHHCHGYFRPCLGHGPRKYCVFQGRLAQLREDAYIRREWLEV
jgi:branched-chain amino acid transport system ATP-binding protein